MLLIEKPGQTELFTVNGERKQVSYLTRVDPFTGNVAKISEERARRAVGISVELRMQPVENCVFCAFKENTPGERIEHGCGAITVPNRYPWEKYDWITIYPPFTKHKLFLSDLYFEDLERMIESSYDLARICQADPEVISFMDFTNWGVFAGASQQHPHSQRKSITGAPSPTIKNEMEHCLEFYQRYGRNPFDMLVDEERADGRRVIHDNEIFITSMFAPSCPDEILIFPKEDISHILQTSASDRKRIIQPVLGVFPGLFFYRGITDLNIAVHMAPFEDMEESRHYYRWHMHVYPRRARLPIDKAGAEIGFGTGVIDTLPETTAELLRRWYCEGPREELVVKTTSGAFDPMLLKLFHNLPKSAVC